MDSGCSNHMIGTKDWLFDYDDTFRESVKLGDDSRMQIIIDVYYLPGLRNNFLSIDKLQQKNLTIVFHIDTCKVYNAERGLVMSTQMSSN